MSTLRLALVGTGKMGQAVRKEAEAKGWEVAASFSSSLPLTTSPETRRRLSGVTTVIDFSEPDAVLPTARALAKLEMDVGLVIGTTGWHDRFDELRGLVEERRLGAVHAANFSLGTHLVFRLAEQAARLFASFPEYEPYIEEAHHKNKKDSPSGTARELAGILAGTGRESIPITSLRAGSVTGSHRIGFDSPVDVIRIDHQARSRRGFALGALLAAQWVVGRQGLYPYKEVLDALLAEPSAQL